MKISLFACLFAVVLAKKEKGPLLRIRKSVGLVRSWIDEQLDGYRRLPRVDRIVDRIEAKLRASFNATTEEVVCKPPRAGSLKPEIPEEEDESVQLRKWPKDPQLQIKKMAKNFRKIANDYTQACRKHFKVISLSNKLEVALGKGLLDVIRNPPSGSGDSSGD